MDKSVFVYNFYKSYKTKNNKKLKYNDKIIIIM